MNELKTLSEYTEDAKKIIIHRLGYSKKWLTDENIGMVINQLVYADKNYDPSKGSINNFRYHSSLIAIKRITANKKNNHISLSTKVHNKVSYKYNSETELSNILEDKNLEKETYDVSDILNNKQLTELERFYLKEYYINGKSQTDIAKERGVTNRAVSFGINSAIRKLKKVFNVNENK